MSVIEVPLQSDAPESFRIPTTSFDFGAMCDDLERRQDSEPAIFPSLLFTEDEVRSVNWDAVFANW